MRVLENDSLPRTLPLPTARASVPGGAALTIRAVGALGTVAQLGRAGLAAATADTQARAAFGCGEGGEGL